MTRKIHFIDYDTMGYKHLGVYFYEGKIFLFEDAPTQVQTYEFRVEIAFDRVLFTEKPPFSQILVFTHTCNVTDYLEWNEYEFPKGTVHKTRNLNWQRLIDEVCPNKFKEIIERLRRFEDNIVPPPMMVSEKQEFLAFDESACCWAGPYKHDNKKGCYATASESQSNGYYPVLDVKHQFRFYELPYNVQDRLNAVSNRKNEKNEIVYSGHNVVYGMDPIEKEQFFNRLSPEEQYITAKNHYFKDYYKETVEAAKPYRLYLAGNDDSSYTRWFSTKSEMDNEMIYLRKMQPLNFTRDIADRGYIFTN